MKYTTVSIPEPLNKKIKKFIKNTGFASTSAFVIYILREVLANKTDVSPLADREKIMEQLRNLVYTK